MSTLVRCKGPARLANIEPVQDWTSSLLSNQIVAFGMVSRRGSATRSGTGGCIRAMRQHRYRRADRLPRPGWPSLADLASRGVARISFGPGLYRASQALLDRMLTRIRAGADPYA